MINGKDAYITWGVRMDKDFLDSINSAASMKEYITNESRNENGVRISNPNPKIASKTITLNVTLQGDNRNDFRTKKDAFFNELYKGDISIKVPQDSEDVYHLKYQQGVSYGQNINRTFCKMALKFIEPNPANRI